jgi:hypothetical protein
MLLMDVVLFTSTEYLLELPGKGRHQGFHAAVLMRRG